MTTAFSGKTQKGPWRHGRKSRLYLLDKGRTVSVFQVFEVDENLEVHR